MPPPSLVHGWLVLASVALFTNPGCVRGDASRAAAAAPPPARTSESRSDQRDASTVAAPASAPVAAADSRPIASASASARVVSHLPSEEVARPFAPPAGHSPIADDVAPVDAASVYDRRAPDPGAPAIAIAGSSWLRGRPLTPLDEPLRVRVAPGATVVWYATALGTFANGRHDLAVTADDAGLATVAFKPGQDQGDYQVIAVSPACSGVATFTLLVDR